MKKNVPKSVKMMLGKFNRSLPPQKRKTVQVACVIHAKSIEWAAKELEELARTVRECGTGYVGHGGGYYMSISYAATRT